MCALCWDADGSLRDFLEWKNSDLLTCNGAAFVVDYSQVPIGLLRMPWNMTNGLAM